MGNVRLAIEKSPSYIGSATMLCDIANTLIITHTCRYFLVELRFESDDDRRRILSSLTARGLQQELRKAVKLLFGDYGLASVQYSLSSVLHSLKKDSLHYLKCLMMKLYCLIGEFSEQIVHSFVS